MAHSGRTLKDLNAALKSIPEFLQVSERYRLCMTGEYQNYYAIKDAQTQQLVCGGCSLTSAQEIARKLDVQLL